MFRRRRRCVVAVRLRNSCSSDNHNQHDHHDARRSRRSRDLDHHHADPITIWVQVSRWRARAEPVSNIAQSCPGSNPAVTVAVDACCAEARSGQAGSFIPKSEPLTPAASGILGTRTFTPSRANWKSSIPKTESNLASAVKGVWTE